MGGNLLCAFNCLQPMKKIVFSVVASRATGRLQIKPRSSGDENGKKDKSSENFSLMRSAFRHCVCEEFFAWNFALRQWFPICAQIIPSLRAVFKFQDEPFRLLYSFLRIGFYTVELPILWPKGEKSNSTETYLGMYFHYVIYSHRCSRNF